MPFECSGRVAALAPTAADRADCIESEAAAPGFKRLRKAGSTGIWTVCRMPPGKAA